MNRRNWESPIVWVIDISLGRNLARLFTWIKNWHKPIALNDLRASMILHSIQKVRVRLIIIFNCHHFRYDFWNACDSLSKCIFVQNFNQKVTNLIQMDLTSKLKKVPYHSLLVCLLLNVLSAHCLDCMHNWVNHCAIRCVFEICWNGASSFEFALNCGLWQKCHNEWKYQNANKFTSDGT